MKCKKCNKKITEGNLGMDIDIGIVCKKCYFEHLSKIIKDIDGFRKSSEFDDTKKLMDKKIELDEKMGNWHDTPEHIFGVEDYLKFSKEELQISLLGEFLDLVEEREGTKESWERTKHQEDILKQMKGIKNE